MRLRANIMLTSSFSFTIPQTMSFSHRGNQEDSQRRQPSSSLPMIPSYSSSFRTPTSIGRASAGRGDPQCRVSPNSVAVFNDSCQGEEQQRPPSRAGSSSGGRHYSNNANFVHGRSSPTPKPKTSEKHKTEMCKNMLEHGFCKYGDGCHYAHSEAERRNTTKVPDGQLMRPCFICTMTGAW